MQAINLNLENQDDVIRRVLQIVRMEESVNIKFKSCSLFGKDHTDADVRAKVRVLIEAPGCFPNLSVWNNIMLQAANLSVKNAEQEGVKAIKMVRMEGAATSKYKNCSLGMKQRNGIAMDLLRHPQRSS